MIMPGKLTPAVHLIASILSLDAPSVKYVSHHAQAINSAVADCTKTWLKEIILHSCHSSVRKRDSAASTSGTLEAN